MQLRKVWGGGVASTACSLLYSLRSRSCVGHSTKYPLYLQSNERELWTAVTALNINVAYLCASQVSKGVSARPPPMGM
jgi:hypothetical protein